MRRLLPAAVNWALAGYAVALCVGVWIFALQHVQMDYRSTLELERDHLRSVSATLQAQVEAMLGDGVGAALAAANELETRSRPSAAGDTEVSGTLIHMLTGGPYVRSLFLSSSQRFMRVGRSGTRDSRSAAPEWLHPPLDLKRGDGWVGEPIPDPDNPGERVIPVAQRIGRGGPQEGWAGALIAFNRLENAYRQPESGSGVALFRNDGTTLALIFPDAKVRESVGSNIGNSALFRQAISGPSSGLIEGPSTFSERQTIAAYDRVSGYPILVAASRRREDALAAWYGRRRGVVLLSIGITSLVLVTTGILNHFLRALRRREIHYRTLFNNAAFGAFVMEGEQIVEANRTSASMFGTGDPVQLIGKRIWELSPPTQPGGASSRELSLERIGGAVTTGAASFEWIHQRLDSRAPFFAAVDLSSLDAEGRTLTLSVIHDVSQRKLMDDERERVLNELHELAAELVHVQDDERRRIGRDLHDSTGQGLAGLELSLARLARIVDPLSNSAKQLVNECVALARQCSNEIRTASYLLHPPLLDEIGLLSALRWLADGLRQRSGIKIDLELPDSMDRLPREHELAIFRVAQEALTNVHRHSKSPSVLIRLFEEDDAMVLEVDDAGQGILGGTSSGRVMDAAALGVGLAGMRERMRQLGGELSVRTGAQGTCVRARLSASSGGGARVGQFASLQRG